MKLAGTNWNLQQQFVSKYSDQPTELQLSLGEKRALSVHTGGQTYGGLWDTSETLDSVFILMTFDIGSTTFKYSGFVNAIQEQYGMAGTLSINGRNAGAWDALSAPAS